MKPIVVVGSINMDLVTRAERIPRPGETLIGTDFQLHSGGKGANQAVAVAKLGYPCTLLGAVGDDVFGTDLLHTLARYGVDTKHVRRVPGSSGTASIVVGANAENCIVVTPGSNASVTQEYLSQQLAIIQNAGLVLLQLEIPIESVEWVVRCCAENKVPVMLDPAPACSLPAELFGNIEWFTPNQTEAEFYADGASSIDAVLGKLLATGIRNVILKRGSEGALIATSNGERSWTDAFEVAAVDTTAAGDAFNGAFGVALMRGMSVAQAARFAAAAAALSVTRCGAQPSLATQQEVAEFMTAAQ
jgi:ribokinase